MFGKCIRAFFILGFVGFVFWSHDTFFQLRRQFRHVEFTSFLLPVPKTASVVQVRATADSTSTTKRVLAIVTGGWALQRYATQARLALLHDQLLRFVAACEQGYDVHVQLLTYLGWEASSYVDASRYFCARVGQSLNVSVSLFPLEPLPPTAYGTEGTLAFQHRYIFAREAERYDLFLVQEDDVAIMPHHFEYFLHWATQFRGTDFYPSLLFYEIASWRGLNDSVFQPKNAVTPSHAMLDARLSDAYILRHRSEPLLSLSSTACCAYFLTQAQLLLAMSKESWLGSMKEARGEFNPRFGSARWLLPDYRVVLPARDIRRALMWHVPNRYVALTSKNEAAGVPTPPETARLSLAEADAVFSLCWKASDNVGKWATDPHLLI
jgi:hypothetical protein